MSATLVLPEEIYKDIAAATKVPVETAGVLLARRILDPNGNVRLLARSMHWIPENEYVVRTAVEMVVASSSYIRPLAEAEKNGEIAIWLHTHPADCPPIPSDKDIRVNAEIADVFRIRTSSEYYSYLILSITGDGFDFTGRIEGEREVDCCSIDRLWCVGNRLKFINSFDRPKPAHDPFFDRNIRAFGPAIQQTLGDLHVSIVGCGGTGSAVAEQLVRLGVRKMTLIDPDILSDSNITRVYGSTPKDIGRPKVEVQREHLSKIAPSLECEAIQGMITTEAVARKLISADLVFGCSDDNAGRIVLSRLSTYFIVPVIDCGILLASDDRGNLLDINGRITTMVPGQGCMICRKRVDLIRARTEMMTPDERIRLENEGYAPSLGRVEPAVVTFTTSVAAWAVTELLERMIGFGPDPRPSEVLIRYHDREISTNLASPLGRHFCNPVQGKLGLGITKPFLEQVWP